MVNPYNNFDSRINCFYWRIIPYGDEPKTSWACWHMFRPYNHNIFKIGMNSQYFLKKEGGRFWEKHLKKGNMAFHH